MDLKSNGQQPAVGQVTRGPRIEQIRKSALNEECISHTLKSNFLSKVDTSVFKRTSGNFVCIMNLIFSGVSGRLCNPSYRKDGI